MKENHLEEVCHDWLADAGWTCVSGEAVAPGGELGARERWTEVVLAPQLRAAMTRLLAPQALLDFFRGFVAYGGADGGESFKIIAQYHQYHGVKAAIARALEALTQRQDGKGGVVWFTQGSGKSLLALFYVMGLRDLPEFRNPTVVLVTDRNDLDGQLYETFADCAWSLRATPQQAENREDLRALLGEVPAGGIYFTTINKFAPLPGERTVPVLCDRSNVVVIADEAHRTQYGFTAEVDTRTGQTKYGLAKYMRDALPNAVYLGMTGTPISLDDRDTEAVFGSYVDIYDMIAAQEDGAVVPVSYESRIIELRFNEAEKQALMDEFLEVTDDEDTSEQGKTASRHTRLEALAMADGRLETLAADLVTHWEARKQSVAGKGMIVAISREAAVRLYDEIVKLRPAWHSDEPTGGRIKVVMTGTGSRKPFVMRKLSAESVSMLVVRDPFRICLSPFGQADSRCFVQREGVGRFKYREQRPGVFPLRVLY